MFRVSSFACAILLLLLPNQFGLASESFELRVARLSKSNESFAAARKILERKEINTLDELRQAIGYLDNALRQETAARDKSVIQTTLAKIYLSGMRDCVEAKRHSAAAVAADPDSPDALESDVASDMCIAGTTKNYNPVIKRLEKLAAQGRYFGSLYSMLGIAYEIRSDQTNAPTDLLKARDAFLKAKERGEPEASPNALNLSIEDVDPRLKRRADRE